VYWPENPFLSHHAAVWIRGSVLIWQMILHIFYPDKVHQPSDHKITYLSDGYMMDQKGFLYKGKMHTSKKSSSYLPTYCYIPRWYSTYPPTYLPTHLSLHTPNHLPTCRSTHLLTFVPTYLLLPIDTYLSAYNVFTKKVKTFFSRISLGFSKRSIFWGK